MPIYAPKQSNIIDKTKGSKIISFSQGAFFVKRREVLQKTRAEQFGLGRVPPTIKSRVSSTEKRSPHADMLVGHRVVKGYTPRSSRAEDAGSTWLNRDLMVTEGCVSFSTESTMAEGCALGTIDLKTTEKRVSSATELKMAERHVSGTSRAQLD
ncbi:hypothetical protein B296_00045026 [Ensete ventricosum]|uniref:Uncharacterized protein n=1 Tax=Ensete ventricosum TaxID=4639 RepID=A0A426Z8S3_ENSVE|nr:hypothetical protein B296_00045026 [Ensete ventricosum]